VIVAVCIKEENRHTHSENTHEDDHELTTSDDGMSTFYSAGGAGTGGKWARAEDDDDDDADDADDQLDSQARRRQKGRAREGRIYKHDKRGCKGSMDTLVQCREDRAEVPLEGGKELCKCACSCLRIYMCVICVVCNWCCVFVCVYVCLCVCVCVCVHLSVCVRSCA
jgi:hypothetical protein